ncbi:hypothetical protein MYCTH_2295846 [Thermothelomyces thermophilus ATCC 42464]|uniref:Uncharacterized protein n=1 Tax=Thermothelomyces thermophilus (strain ATCC 42464 / BCRC 31852 / DSM 1799) TaxID=573729 RepID=G2Q6T2_THET4|nr:uncharacterized protein MYCTH_2295846 [Thermothelomyces thermophilus ATCC 42464]AEO53910.1 hypothetical protein MYCTH_2295846 [Thermothelomyces thermophilus ATCC 42464]
MSPAVGVVVDLTMDTSPSDTSAADEVVVAAAHTVSVDSTNGDSIPARRSSISASNTQPRNSPSAAKPGRAQSPQSAASQKRAPNAPPAGRQAQANDSAPPRDARLSARDEIRDSQSPPPSVQSAAQQQPHTPQLPNQPSKGHQTPGTQTPKETEWTVDKIASALAELSEQVAQGHARLVEFVLEEAEKKARRPRHLSDSDDFADMRSIALDSSASAPQGVETMAVKFKASCGSSGEGSDRQG